MTKSLLFDQAMQEWGSLLGSERAICDPEVLIKYQNNITEFKRQIPAVLKPRNREDVIKIIEIANKYQVPLYPVSQGKNWGQGSALPVTDDCVLVVLESLNQIIEVNERLRYAIIEPGVTQKQLSDYLISIGSRLLFSMTGSGNDTSIIGNILERGSACYGQRSQNIIAAEVLFGNGANVRTGNWQFENEGNTTHFYRHGLGPDINGLLCQSNFGIVLSMVVSLMPLRKQKLVFMKFPQDQIEKITDALFYLKEDQIICGGPVILNRFDHRMKKICETHQEENSWFMATTLRGNGQLLLELQKEFESRLQSIDSNIQYFDHSALEDPNTPQVIKTFINLFDGIPSNFSLDSFKNYISDNQVKTAHYDIDNDSHSPGMACVLPAVPFVGSSVREIIDEINSFSTAYPFKIGFTFVTHNSTSFEGFFRVIFNRDSLDEITLAHEWSRLLYKILEKKGLYPYRLNIEQMSYFTDRIDNPFWNTIALLKSALDPNGIISPGRYCPLVGIPQLQTSRMTTA